MDKFLSCDWGTSSFRLRLVSTPTLQILAEERTDDGIAAVFNLWKEKKEGEEDRLNFYLTILKKKIKSLEQQLSSSLENIPIIISGMASSTIGMIEIPYKPLPFHLNGSDLITKKIDKASELLTIFLLFRV
jgi:2-dehydro-3-deoxygalactonokinase